MSLEPCARCGRHVRVHETRCPFCSDTRTPLGAAALIGATLSLLACGGENATSEGSAKPAGSASAKTSASATAGATATTTATASATATTTASAEASASASAASSASASAAPSVVKPAPTVPHAVPAYGMPAPDPRPRPKYGMPPRDVQ